MKRTVISVVMIMAAVYAVKAHVTTSPDGQTAVTVTDDDGRLGYNVIFMGDTVIRRSALGLVTSLGDYTRDMKLTKVDNREIDERYTLRNSKRRDITYHANEMTLSYTNKDGLPMDIIFRVSNNNIAFRYALRKKDDRAAIVVRREATAFRLADGTKTFLCPQSDAMVGWKRTKPSYEEEYRPDAELTDASSYGHGFTFPCLFRQGERWLLISETGTDGQYAGCHLSDWDTGAGYTIAFPMDGELNGLGSATPGMLMDCQTPWRTITVGASLAPIVETTITWDVTRRQYEPSTDYDGGRYTWSWLIWQDNSINYDDQVAFINTASQMGYEYCLVDGCWDVNIGRERIAELSRYARSKNVSLLLWYNSNGYENDALQTPKNRMNSAAARHKEMAWMKSIGVKGIKVDFFGGDKQPTMQLYEDILSDANEYGLQVIFHGCTLPRGWEKMYPNYVASEAVLASENVYFSEYHARKEAFELTIHPFCRNTVGSMDWGGTIMNKYLSRDNKSRHKRYTTDVFEMAAALMNQTTIQCVAIQPNNLSELPSWELDFLRSIPTEVTDTRFIDGYPGRYASLARQYGDRWFYFGMNAEQEKTLTITTHYEKGTRLIYYNDYGEPKVITVGSKGRVKVKMKENGAFILSEQ